MVQQADGPPVDAKDIVTVELGPKKPDAIRNVPNFIEELFVSRSREHVGFIAQTE